MAGNGQPARLNEALFNVDADHEAYASEANDVLMAAPSVSSTAQAIAGNHLADVAARSSLTQQFNRWGRDFDEAFRTAFVLADVEDWSDLDDAQLRALVEECYSTTNEMREAVGSDRVERSDFNKWISILHLRMTGATAGP